MSIDKSSWCNTKLSERTLTKLYGNWVERINFLWVFFKPTSVRFNSQSLLSDWWFSVGCKLRAYLHGEKLSLLRMFPTQPSREPLLPSDYNVWKITISFLSSSEFALSFRISVCLIPVIFRQVVTSNSTLLLTCDLNSAPLLLKRVVYGIILKVLFNKLLVGRSFLFVFLSLGFLTFINVQELYKQKHNWAGKILCRSVLDCLQILFICNTHQSLSLGIPVKKAVFQYLVNDIDHLIIPFNLICLWQISCITLECVPTGASRTDDDFRVVTVSIVILIRLKFNSI